jgi:hypothetical protein
MKIFRFKFSTELNNEIMNFSDIHKFDTDDNLVDTFNEWIEKPHIKELMDKEEVFLVRNEYEMSIEKKVFKSIKYYYIKKFIKNVAVGITERKETVKLSIEIMNEIKEDLKLQFEKNPNFKPSETYKQFKKNDDPYIKKSYKNQYYQMKNKMYM